MDKHRVERRTDKHGVIVSMAAAKGFVMVRRPGCIPFVLSGREWAMLPYAPPTSPPALSPAPSPHTEST